MKMLLKNSFQFSDYLNFVDSSNLQRIGILSSSSIFNTTKTCSEPHISKRHQVLFFRSFGLTASKVKIHTFRFPLPLLGIMQSLLVRLPSLSRIFLARLIDINSIFDILQSASN